MKRTGDAGAGGALKKKKRGGCAGCCCCCCCKNKSFEDDYALGTEIGRGAFGSVHVCRNKADGKLLACKTVARKAAAAQDVRKEADILQSLSGHPGVVSLKAAYEDHRTLRIVTELCSGGTLSDQMARQGCAYSEKRAAGLFKELMAAIKHCHDNGVVHRDVKPQNILIAFPSTLKLADFGLARTIASGGQSLSGLAGTPAFIAPEVLDGGKYCEKVDIWSAGILLYTLLTGSFPFRSTSRRGIFQEIRTARFDFCSDKSLSISKPARDLLQRMLTRDMRARLSADEVLAHPWLLLYTSPALLPRRCRPVHCHAAKNVCTAF